MCVRVLWYVSVMNATTDHSKDGVLYVEELESQMPITAKSVRNRRKTEMVVPRLLTLEARKPICSMNVRNMDSKNDDDISGFFRDCTNPLIT